MSGGGEDATVAVIQAMISRGVRRFALGLAGAVLAAAPSLAWAAIDGSAPLLCSPSTVMECDAGSCERVTADDSDLPSFLRIDVPNKLVTALPAGRRTTIKTVVRLDGRLILQGSEATRSWTATIAEDTGRLSIAVADPDHIFAVFGACIVP